MKALSKQREAMVAMALREAHWAGTAGEPVCPDCHDGADVVVVGRLPRCEALRVYYCRACGRRFNDVTGTALESTWTPLHVWAGAACLLAAAPHLGKPDAPSSAFRAIDGWSDLPRPQRRTLCDVLRRLAAWDFGLRWAALLMERGFCGKRVGVAPATGGRKRR